MFFQTNAKKTSKQQCKSWISLSSCRLHCCPAESIGMGILILLLFTFCAIVHIIVSILTGFYAWISTNECFVQIHHCDWCEKKNNNNSEIRNVRLPGLHIFVYLGCKRRYSWLLGDFAVFVRVRHSKPSIMGSTDWTCIWFAVLAKIYSSYFCISQEFVLEYPIIAQTAAVQPCQQRYDGISMLPIS